MYDDKDMWLLEKYISERPKQIDDRRQAYADWALGEILDSIMEEDQKLPYYISGEESIPIKDIVNDYLLKMRYFCKIAKPGTKLMFRMALKEAESLSLFFCRKDA